MAWAKLQVPRIRFERCGVDATLDWTTVKAVKFVFTCVAGSTGQAKFDDLFVTAGADGQALTGVFRARYKYIFNIAHGLPYPFASDLYASPTWQGTLASGQKMYGKRTVEAYIHRPRHELYDLEADPDELHNLADKPEQAAKLAELQKLVRDWQAQTRDPWVSKWTYE